MFLENVVPSADAVLALPDLEYIRMPEAIFTRTATNSEKKNVYQSLFTRRIQFMKRVIIVSNVCERERERETALGTTLVRKIKRICNCCLHEESPITTLKTEKEIHKNIYLMLFTQ